MLTFYPDNKNGDHRLISGWCLWLFMAILSLCCVLCCSKWQKFAIYSLLYIHVCQLWPLNGCEKSIQSRYI